MRLGLIEVAHPEIETVVGRNPGAIGPAHCPLADTAGRVAGRFQQFGNRHILRLKDVTSVRVDRRMARMPAGPQHDARRSADGAAGVVACQLQPLGRQLIQVGCSHHLLAETSQISVAQVVRHNEDDVWRTTTCRILTVN